MKKILNVILATLTIGLFASCNTESDGRSTYENIPAIVQYDNAFNPQIKTGYGLFAAPELATKALNRGTCLLTNFTIDMSMQTSKEIVTVSNLQYIEIGKSVVKSVDVLEDDYTEVINNSSLFSTVVDNTIFFAFSQQAPQGQKFDYEIIFKTDAPAPDGSNSPVLYIRSKKANGETSGSNTSMTTVYAFNMTPFLEHMKQFDPDPSEIQLYIKYKYGEDANGNDMYKQYQPYPVSWRLK